MPLSSNYTSALWGEAIFWSFYILFIFLDGVCNVHHNWEAPPKTKDERNGKRSSPRYLLFFCSRVRCFPRGLQSDRRERCWARWMYKSKPPNASRSSSIDSSLLAPPQGDFWSLCKPRALGNRFKPPEALNIFTANWETGRRRVCPSTV